ncbi:hypothetical protein AGLY_017871 [Aphis glycines]|uniref:Uncharacterized protein n=1 Tax=Aphis glycines TaxID=307491 RepID=A0A6G0STP7_APHGL|nr:hypothetical protein AGLY_017871 [Aphis glycines]
MYKGRLSTFVRLCQTERGITDQNSNKTKNSIKNQSKLLVFLYLVLYFSSTHTHNKCQFSIKERKRGKILLKGLKTLKISPSIVPSISCEKMYKGRLSTFVRLCRTERGSNTTTWGLYGFVQSANSAESDRTASSSIPRRSSIVRAASATSTSRDVDKCSRRLALSTSRDDAKMNMTCDCIKIE